MSAPAASDDALYLRLFPPQEQADAVARLILANQDKEPRILEEWYARCASSFGAHQALSRRVFDEIYVPSLRSAYVHLCRRDPGAFVAFGRTLGERLAHERVPFVAYVAYLHFLRQSYAAVLASDGATLQEALDLIDSIHSRLVSIVADGYHRALREERTVPRDAAPPPPIEPFHGMVGRSPSMRRVFHKIDRIAAHASPVLILGETGTGKELVARAIHRAGPRHDGPFIAVNCAALPRELIESELFGYRRGAFSGAVAECLGLFRAASGGTLLLDEVTEMAPELQAKLLRVLEDRTVRPVGSMQEVPVDVRVIASSNREPDAAMAGGLLRPDLYYRLSSSSIHLPPLRERADDIPLLAAHYLRLLAGHAPSGGEAHPHLTERALDLLVAQPWPGNVRELFNVLDEAWSMRGGADLDVGDLPVGPRREPAEPAPALSPLDAAERALIERTLRDTGGNKVKAARRLGISRTSLYAKLARYRLTATVRPL